MLLLGYGAWLTGRGGSLLEEETPHQPAQSRMLRRAKLGSPIARFMLCLYLLRIHSFTQ